MLRDGGRQVNPSPKVSIGLPVFNGEQSLDRVITTLLNQSFADFELIISDNASTDSTEIICREYASRDPRIRYIRQPHNLGATNNFKFVLDQSRGQYYMWAAADDLRSVDFIAENIDFLETHQNYIASTSPNFFVGDDVQSDQVIRFNIEGTLQERYLIFLRYCWISHGIFYSLMRTEVIKRCKTLGYSFTAADWAINFFLVSQGSIHRTQAGLITLGRDGVSSRPGAWGAFRNSSIELLLPLYQFSYHALKIIKPLPWLSWWPVFGALALLNLKASMNQAHAVLYDFYCRHFKSAK